MMMMKKEKEKEKEREKEKEEEEEEEEEDTEGLRPFEKRRFKCTPYAVHDLRSLGLSEPLHAALMKGFP